MKIITICGSMKFIENMLEMALKLELDGNCCLLPIYTNNALSESKIMCLNKMHQEKIKLSDAIFVVNVNGYIGILGACYLFIIMFNSGLSITNYHLVPSHENFVYMIGSLIFISSDLVLTLHKFGKNSPDFLQIVYRVLYYASQIILASYIGLI